MTRATYRRKALLGLTVLEADSMTILLGSMAVDMALK